MLFLFRFVCIELVSLIWVLQIWVAIYVYGTMINWSSLIKKLMQTYIVIVSGSILNVSTVHLNGIWHLIWRYLLKPVLGGHPVLSGHYSIPWGCPLNTGFTVCSELLHNTRRDSSCHGNTFPEKMFVWGGSTPVCNSFAFYIHAPFFAKKYSFRIPSFGKWYLFHIPFL